MSLNGLVSDPCEPALELNVTNPISPPPVKGGGRNELPAYVANGVVGLRVREMPLAAGLTLLSGYSGSIRSAGSRRSRSPHIRSPAISSLEAFGFQTQPTR